MGTDASPDRLLLHGLKLLRYETILLRHGVLDLVKYTSTVGPGHGSGKKECSCKYSTEVPAWKLPVCSLGGLWLQHAKPLEATGNAWATSCMDVWQSESGWHNGNLTPPPYIHCRWACKTTPLLLVVSPVCILLCSLAQGLVYT